MYMYVKLAPSWALSSFVNEVLLTIKRRKAKEQQEEASI
jgi:hypothetical protein